MTWQYTLYDLLFNKRILSSWAIDYLYHNSSKDHKIKKYVTDPEDALICVEYVDSEDERIKELVTVKYIVDEMH